MNSKTQITVNVKMKADFSWWTALKLRLSGGEYIKEVIESQIKKRSKDNNDS